MAWTRVYRDLSKQDSTQTTAADDGTRTQQRIQTWAAECDGDGRTVDLVQAESANDGTNAIPTAGGLYTIGGQAGWRCTQTLPKRTGPNTFEVQVTYQRKTQTPAPGGIWNVDISIGGQSFTQTAYKDKDGHAVENKAGCPFDPALPETFYDERISITYNTTNADSAAFAPLRGKVNSSPASFNIRGMTRTFDKRKLKCEDAKMSSTFPSGDASPVPVWKVTIDLIARQDEFTDHVLNQGYMVKNDAGELVNAKDKNKIDVTSPVKLDNDGKRLADGADPVFLDFKIEGEADLSPLFAGLS